MDRFPKAYDGYCWLRIVYDEAHSYVGMQLLCAIQFMIVIRGLPRGSSRLAEKAPQGIDSPEEARCLNSSVGFDPTAGEY